MFAWPSAEAEAEAFENGEGGCARGITPTTETATTSSDGPPAPAIAYVSDRQRATRIQRGRSRTAGMEYPSGRSRKRHRGAALGLSQPPRRGR
ncbi:hypothetical protein HMPREF0185_00109 [Brevundimonas diminuta 470-4]|nr:hypothetical protein HMPREF0185_00109 [Brevundimonas diminuta 470-4]